MRLVRFLLHYLRRYSAWIALSILSILAFAGATTVLVSLINPIFDEVLLTEGGDLRPLGGVVGPEGAGGAESGMGATLNLTRLLAGAYERLTASLGVGSGDTVWFVPLLFVVLFVLRGLADFASGYSFQQLGLGLTTDIREDLYRNILHQSSRFHAEHPSGELVSRVVSDVAVMQNAVSNRLLDLFQQAVTLLFLLYLLLSTDLKLALICLVLAPALLYPIVRFGEGMRASSHRSQQRMADLANLMAEGVRGHRVVKAFGMEGFEFERFRKAARRHLRVNLWAQLLSNLSGPVVESLAVIGAAALLVYAGYQIRSGELSGPLFIQFLSNLLFMYDPIRKLNKVNLVVQQARAAAQRVIELLDVPNEVEERPAARAAAGVERSVAFEDVCFAYEERPVLRHLTLRIRSGETVALVGPSGAGKSTLVSLLPRFFDPDSGRVAIDGVDIRDLTLKSLRALVGIVTQETILFNDTVRNNIAYGRSDLPREQIREAAAAAYADDFIMELPRAYDSVIGESGLRLSGGQRQRLAIARALLKNAPILILDEATSQLDSESEALVQKALQNLMHGRTTLVIAHRLSTVTAADRIVVMEEGRVVEEGAHEVLLALGGVYKRLYDLQFRA